MSTRFVPAIVAAALAAVLVAPAAAGASSHASSARASAQKQCASTSKTGTKPSKYNRTPKGSTWHVPKDPCNTEGWGLAGNYYVNCAYWAAEKRPDLWVKAVWVYGYSTTRPGAWRIKDDAKRAGFPLSHRPHRGDIASWGRNAPMGVSVKGLTLTASPGGHVGYVDKVLHHGRIKLSTMGMLNAHGGPLLAGKTMVLRYSKHTSFIHHMHHH